MTMFRKRDMRTNSPFRKRVGFIDQWFMSIMQRDFASTPKSAKLTFDAEYLDHFNGVLPSSSATNKRWWHDIDNLYGIVNVGGDHWVAVDIDFPKEFIYVYDSIPSHRNDKQLVEDMTFLRKMMPAILNICVPDTHRRRSSRMFKLSRVRRNVPVNKTAGKGDCGIFSIKYVECLALGWSFEGLNDDNIVSLRRRLAVELFEEVPDTRGSPFVHSSDPNPRPVEPYFPPKTLSNM